MSPRDAVLTAQRVLDAVVCCAARGGAPNLDRITRLALLCSANGSAHARGLTFEEHCDALRAALFHAEHGQWFLLAEALEHGEEAPPCPGP